MDQPLDTIIIGAGTAGLAALREVRKRTNNYLIVNEGPWGTTCARVGCMPSKTLIEAANAFHRRRAFDEPKPVQPQWDHADVPAAGRRDPLDRRGRRAAVVFLEHPHQPARFDHRIGEVSGQ